MPHTCTRARSVSSQREVRYFAAATHDMIHALLCLVEEEEDKASAAAASPTNFLPLFVALSQIYHLPQSPKNVILIQDS